jgi:hypothetical protein
VASAGITVSVTYTATSSAWSFSDVSSGAASDASAASAFAGDGLTFGTGAWSNAFASTRYLDFDMNSSLPGGFAVTGGNFNFRYAAAAAGETACFYFEVRTASTGAVVATHGSTSTPAGCVTGTTLQTVSTSLPELTNDIANDLRIHVYVRESGSKKITVDMGTVTGTTSSTAFTLYANSYTDASTGAASTSPWLLFANGDGVTYNSNSNWPAAPSSSNYLQFTFPGYLWSGATVNSATFTHSFRAFRSGNTACYYADVYAGATLIGSHGTSASPYSCNATNSYQTDAIPLPEVNTAARANSVVVKLYFSISGNANKTTLHDFAQLSVNYK